MGDEHEPIDIGAVTATGRTVSPVGPQTMRVFERYGVVVPYLDSRGRAVHTEESYERAALALAYVEAGYPLSSVREFLDDDVQQRPV